MALPAWNGTGEISDAMEYAGKGLNRSFLSRDNYLVKKFS
jgi:hypothetical protein